MSDFTDKKTAFYDDETLLDEAFAIFMELAPENLSEAAITLFNTQFNENGTIALYEPENDWEAYVDIPVDPTYLAEVVIGLKPQNPTEVSPYFARILISTEVDEKFCHVLWNADIG